MADKVKAKARKIDTTWQKLDAKYNIVSAVKANGIYKISADEIKEFQEPRLAVKFDHKEDRPELFVNNGLSILPVTRGDYIVSQINAYHNFGNYDAPIIYRTVPEYIQSLTASSITSEAKALNIAYISGILADFLEDDGLLPTVAGRMGSGSFVFQASIGNTDELTPTIQVENSQIEIDAAYEGHKSLSLVEAKMNLAENFLIRQLYYPFRTWHKLMGKKPVRPVFLIYSNSIFYLYEYTFTELGNYNSLELVKFSKYTLEDNSISKDEIRAVVASAKVKPNPAIQFPQANDFQRVISLCEQLYLADGDVESISDMYQFHARQALYYADAARYLGLATSTSDSKGSPYTLTTLGKKLWQLSYRERQLQFVKVMASYKVFRESLDYYLATDEIPKTQIIVQFMVDANIAYTDGQNNVKTYSPSTMKRRASTVQSWLKWVEQLITK